MLCILTPVFSKITCCVWSFCGTLPESRGYHSMRNKWMDLSSCNRLWLFVVDQVACSCPHVLRARLWRKWEGWRSRGPAQQTSHRHCNWYVLLPGLHTAHKTLTTAITIGAPSQPTQYSQNSSLLHFVNQQICSYFELCNIRTDDIRFPKLFIPDFGKSRCDCFKLCKVASGQLWIFV